MEIYEFFIIIYAFGFIYTFLTSLTALRMIGKLKISDVFISILMGLCSWGTFVTAYNTLKENAKQMNIKIE